MKPTSIVTALILIASTTVLSFRDTDMPSCNSSKVIARVKDAMLESIKTPALKYAVQAYTEKKGIAATKKQFPNGIIAYDDKTVAAVYAGDNDLGHASTAVMSAMKFVMKMVKLTNIKTLATDANARQCDCEANVSFGGNDSDKIKYKANFTQDGSLNVITAGAESLQLFKDK